VCVCSDPFFSISFHFIPFHSISFGSIPFFISKNGTQRSGTEGGREGDREGEKVKNYFYITWKNGVEWNGTERRQGGRGRRGRESKKLFVYYLENGNAPCYADVE